MILEARCVGRQQRCGRVAGVCQLEDKLGCISLGHGSLLSGATDREFVLTGCPVAALVLGDGRSDGSNAVIANLIERSIEVEVRAHHGVVNASINSDDWIDTLVLNLALGRLDRELVEGPGDGRLRVVVLNVVLRRAREVSGQEAGVVEVDIVGGALLRSGGVSGLRPSGELGTEAVLLDFVLHGLVVLVHAERALFGALSVVVLDGIARLERVTLVGRCDRKFAAEIVLFDSGLGQDGEFSVSWVNLQQSLANDVVDLGKGWCQLHDFDEVRVDAGVLRVDS